MDEQETNLEPIEDPSSECFGCEAGMCSICKDDQYEYNKNLEGDYYE